MTLIIWTLLFIILGAEVDRFCSLGMSYDVEAVYKTSKPRNDDTVILDADFLEWIAIKALPRSSGSS